MDILYIQFLENKKMRCKMEEIREETKAQKEIAAYISRNNISASEVARKTKVDVGLLTGKAERKMNASEMLSVCAYLEIEPLSLI